MKFDIAIGATPPVKTIITYSGMHYDTNYERTVEEWGCVTRQVACIDKTILIERLQYTDEEALMNLLRSAVEVIKEMSEEYEDLTSRIDELEAENEELREEIDDLNNSDDEYSDIQSDLDDIKEILKNRYTVSKSQ